MPKSTALPTNPLLLQLFPSRPHPPAPTTAADVDMVEEEGEVFEAVSATKLAAFKADLTKDVVKELLAAMKEAGLDKSSPPYMAPAVSSPRSFRKTSTLILLGHPLDISVLLQQPVKSPEEMQPPNMPPVWSSAARTQEAIFLE
ncbi:hypothetical protein BC829DRAFT_418452 [Chytridium lagenaria]|nr:hypothetical protein BC829DRAFT_418452 [Chytridium lagenaria]